MYVSVVMSLVLNFFMTFNFFPNLMHYQGGNELAFAIRNSNVQYKPSAIKLIDQGSHSFDFYMKDNHDVIDIDSVGNDFSEQKNPYHYLLTTDMMRTLQQKGYNVQPEFMHINYQVSKVQLKFLKKKSRVAACDSLMLATISKK